MERKDSTSYLDQQISIRYHFDSLSIPPIFVAVSSSCPCRPPLQNSSPRRLPSSLLPYHLLLLLSGSEPSHCTRLADYEVLSVPHLGLSGRTCSQSFAMMINEECDSVPWMGALTSSSIAASTSAGSQSYLLIEG